VATSSSQGQGEKSNSKIVSYDKQSDKLTNYIVEEPDEEEENDEKEKEKSNKKGGSTSTTYTPDYIARQVLDGANYLARGVEKTTEYASSYIQTGGEKLKSNLTPNEQPASVSPGVQKTLQNVRYGTHLTVRVSSYLLNKLGQLATATSKKVAPIIREGSVSLMSKTGVVSDKSAANNYVDGFVTVAASSVQGFATIYDSLENAAKSLASSFANQSVTIVDHKYGPAAAKATENSLYSVGNLAVSANNVKNLKVVRTLAKATAKETLAPADRRQALIGGGAATNQQTTTTTTNKSAIEEKLEEKKKALNNN
jgi:spartin